MISTAQATLIGTIFLSIFVIGGIILWRKLNKIETLLSPPAVDFDPDTTIPDALYRLERAAKTAAVRWEATSAQVDVNVEEGRQGARRAKKIASDLADSISRADNEPSGEPGAAADAGLRSGIEETS